VENVSANPACVGKSARTDSGSRQAASIFVKREIARTSDAVGLSEKQPSRPSTKPSTSGGGLGADARHKPQWRKIFSITSSCGDQLVTRGLVGEMPPRDVRNSRVDDPSSSITPAATGFPRGASQNGYQSTSNWAPVIPHVTRIYSKYAFMQLNDLNGITSVDGGNVILDFVDPDGTGSSPLSLDSRQLFGNAVDQILAQEDVTESLSSPDRVLWHLTDHLQTVRDLAKNDGTLGEHYKYDSYGQIISGDTSLRGQNSRWTWGVSRSNLTMI